MAYEFISDEERAEVIAALRAQGGSQPGLSGTPQSLFGRAADIIDQDGREIKKLQEEQRSAFVADELRDLPVAPKPGRSVVCAEGHHGECLLGSCTCDCHKPGRKMCSTPGCGGVKIKTGDCYTCPECGH